MTSLLTLDELARALKLPRTWIKEQTQKERLPCLRIGRRVLYDQSAVEQTLVKWAQSGYSPLQQRTLYEAPAEPQEGSEPC